MNNKALISACEELLSSDLIKTGSGLEAGLHKDLVLSQTRWVCRHGTLSDGHEKITDAQRYYQSVKEMYSISESIKVHRINLLEAKADLLDGEEDLLNARRESDRLRAQAKIEKAQGRVHTTYVTVKDLLRMLDEYNLVRLELKPIVEAKYPHGIEQAEPDNWKAIFEYRMRKEETHGREMISNIPLDFATKAELGLKYNRPDAVAPLEIAEKHAIAVLANGSVKRYLQLGTERGSA